MFNDKYGLTEAVLSGRKTMTRRIVPQHVFNKAEKYQEEYYNAALATISDKDAILSIATYEYRYRFPQVGEVVAIAQSYETIFKEESLYKKNRLIDIIRAGIIAKTCAGWNNKMFVNAKGMPHHIRITNIRVERLKDISDEDCLREGIIKRHFEEYDEYGYGFHGLPMSKYFCVPRDAFLTLIDKISGKGTWESNPYVFVYDFELVD